MEGEWKHTSCNFCGCHCGLDVLVRDNHIVDVKPGKCHGPQQEPYCCRKGRSSKYHQDNPNRINYPMKKVNGEFVRISWEQAYSEIGTKLRKIIDEHGPRAVATCNGGLGSDQSGIPMGTFALAAFGGKYVYNPVGIEFAAPWWSHGRIVGHQGMTFEFGADVEELDVYILWGANAYVTHNVNEGRRDIRKMSEDPDKMIICVDPRLSETARMSDLHIHPKPGFDALMIRGMIAMILEKGWQDQNFLNKYCTGWDKAVKWYQGVDYKEIFDFVGVPLEQMEEFCHILCTKTWAVHEDLGMICGRHSTLNCYLLDQLMAVTGNMEIKGNKTMDAPARFCMSSLDEMTDKNMWLTVETGKYPVAGYYSPALLPDEIMSKREDRVRAVITDKCNPCRSYPNSDRQEEAFEQLELLVNIDVVMTETSQHADYVLPGCTGFEEYQFGLFQMTPGAISVFLKKPILDVIEERQSSNNIILEIMRAAGYVPEMPEYIYKAAEKSVRERDVLIFMMAFLPWFIAHPKWKNSMNLLVIDALQRYMDNSAALALYRAAYMISELPKFGYCERAGFAPSKKYKWMSKTPMKMLADMSMMDNVFWAVYDAPQGLQIGFADPDPEKQMKNVIIHKDKKLHLFDEKIDNALKTLTVGIERALTSNDEFPDIVSSGIHSDEGVNNAMRNSDTYVYRDPFKLFMHPNNARKKGISDGEIVRIVSKVGSITAPVEYSWNMDEEYSMVPHHEGLFEPNKNRTYGEPANRIMPEDNIDELTNDPVLRFVPCRIEKIDTAEATA